jgi:ribosome-binding factor A
MRTGAAAGFPKLLGLNMSRSHHAQGSEPSQRMLRVAELIRHSTAQILARGEISDPVLEKHVVTVARVKMSPDLKLATVYVMPLGGADEPEVVVALERHKKFLRGELAHMINLKFAPELRFRIDDSFDNVTRIDALLNSEKVRRDLQSHEDETSGEQGDNQEDNGSAR